MMNPLCELYLAYARLFAFPTPQVGKGALDGSVGGALAEMHAQAGMNPPPPLRTTLEPAELEQTYISTFEIGIPEPPAPLYETGYCAPGRSREVLEEILRFYDFFDLKPAGQGAEMPDHLTMELEFMGALVHMDRLAHEHGALTDSFRLAQRDFLARHVLPMLHSLKARPIPEPFYAELLKGLLSLVGTHLENLSCYKPSNL